MKKDSPKIVGKFFTFYFIFIFSGSVFSQNVSVAGAISGNGSYATLGAAFTAINGASQTAANITITIVGNTAEGTTAASLNGGTWNSLSISPSGSRTITGAVTTALVNFNDADNVYMDGLNNAGNALTFSNTSTGTTASTIRFINGATSNTVTNCIVLGASNSATGAGNIHFSTTTVTAGNSFNVISSCTVSCISGGNPAIGILSVGTASVPNTNNVITNCIISDFFKAGIANYGIFISTGNSQWTVTNNKFFQTILRTFTTGAVHKVIAVSSGDNYLVSNNVIGYSSATGTGIYAMAGAVATRFVGIELSAGTLTASSVQGNTVTALTLTTTGTTASANGMLCGINILTGNVAVGTATGNLIGGTSGTGSISLNPTSTAGWLVGINSSSTGSINIANNYIGAMVTTNTAATTAGQIQGVVITGVAALVSVVNNTIGNTTPDNMLAGTATLTTANSVISGINLAGALNSNVTVSGNLIQNCTSYGTGTGGYARGIWNPNNNTTAMFSITNNTITNINSTNSNATIGNGLVGTAGIIISSCNSATISNNLISNVANTGTATTGVVASGIALAGLTNVNGIGMVISFNRIYNVKNTSPGTTITAPPIAAGITIRSGNINLAIYNNMISLGSGATSANTYIGIYGNHASSPHPSTQIYYNTINIEGSAAGALPSFGYLRGDFSANQRTASVDIKNNLITNSRSGGTGGHYAIANNYGALVTSTGWSTGASDNNVLNANSSTVGWWGSAMGLTAWQFASGGDQNSYSGINVNYVNSSNDLHLNMGVNGTPIESGGQVLSSVAVDIDLQTRPGPFNSINLAGFNPDIGADEIDGVEGVGPVISYIPLGITCSTGDRTLTATITDITGVPVSGTTVPKIYFRKNAGVFVSSSGSLTAGTSTNSTWSFTISAAALSGLSLGDNVSYYIVAQDLTSAQNIGASPATGLVAVNVNSITTPPSTPNTYAISSISLSGTYNIGTAGSYTTLSAAANAYNNACLTSSVTFVLTDALYSSLESFPIVFQNNGTASSSNSLLIIPATSTAVAITPTNPAVTSVIKFPPEELITRHAEPAVSCAPS